MNVQLYIYDLSKGLARTWSLPLTGIQIDAIYHTSLVFGGVEYFFGQGIHRKRPGSTHHGQPMEVLQIGRTDLPMDVIQEYLESLEEIYSKESYDLFLHNCNNFTQDLSMFLVGKGIPENIRSLPERFLNTQFGQMMKPQIDNALRGFAQGPEIEPPPSQRRNSFGPRRPSTSNAISTSLNGHTPNGIISTPAGGRVHNITRLPDLDAVLAQASQSCAVIFFTSATCPPCKILYAPYEELAFEFGGKATLVKVDISQAYEIAAKYSVRATPTLMTFLKGRKQDEWLGADENKLQQNVRMLVHMAWPPHPHSNLNLPSFHGPISHPVTYKKSPPLDKLIQKIGEKGTHPSIAAIVSFVRAREQSGRAADAAVPDLRAFATFIQSHFQTLDPSTHFALIDLARIALADSRVSSFFAEEKSHATILTLLSPITTLTSTEDLNTKLPHSLLVTSLQLSCNLFTSSLYPPQILSTPSLLEPVTKLATSCLSSPKANVRVLAASLIYNIAAYNHNFRLTPPPGTQDALPESEQVALTAALLEAIANEKESIDALHGFLFALGLLIYCAPVGGEVWDLCRAMDAREVIAEKGKLDAFKKEPFIKEVGEELFGKGLNQP